MALNGHGHDCRLAARVNELTHVWNCSVEISLDMLRYELRIGPLSDARAERLAFQQANRRGDESQYLGLQDHRAKPRSE